LTDTAPSITSVTFDKASYVPGQLINATVTYVPGTADTTLTFTGTVTDSAGQTGELTAQFVTTANSPSTVTAADSGNRTWTKISDSGTVAVFQATA